MSGETVCAVVVTYNRKELLLECLKALKKQSKPLNAIYIIDNASTDSTPLTLHKSSYLDEIPPSNLDEPWEKEFKIKNLSNDDELRLHYVRMHQNTGGAGGFYEGTKRAYEKGYDWLWLMDDDGIPGSSCLETLLEKKDESQFIAPLPIKSENNSELSFNMEFTYENKRITITRVDEADKYSKNRVIEDIASPFNGILISNDLVKTIGYPEKRFFIWGDETEYLFRAQKHGFKVITYIDAKFYHPEDKAVYKPVLGGLLGNNLVTENLKLYCHSRNHFHIFRKYRGNIYIIAWMGIGILRKLLQADFNGLRIVLKAWRDAFFNKWGGEKEFLNK